MSDSKATGSNVGKDKKRVTIFDVAADAGTSFGTVSRVLNNRGGVSPKTRKAVIESIRRLNYVRHPFAQALATQATGLVGLIAGGPNPMDDRRAFYVHEIEKGVLKGARNAEYHVVLLDSQDCTPQFLRLVDGVVLRGNLNADALERLVSSVPVVAINSSTFSPSINIDYATGAREAIAHLVELGHRRIAIVAGTGSVGSPAKQVRLKVYEEALRRHGLPIERELQSGSVDINDSFDLYQRLDRFFALSDPPTALFVAADIPALETVRYLARRGLSVPKDVSVVGSTDLPVASLVNPELTTVHVPLAQVGARAVQLLGELIRNPEVSPKDVSFSTRLVVRETTAPPPIRR